MPATEPDCFLIRLLKLPFKTGHDSFGFVTQSPRKKILFICLIYVEI